MNGNPAKTTSAKTQGRLYPVCPYCGKIKTLHKDGQFYCCRSCRRLTLKFGWEKYEEGK